MVYAYTPTYYSSFHDSIASLCKTILPFSSKKRQLPASAIADEKLSKRQSDNLKWQQESYHRILNLMGLCGEGIISKSEVSVFRTQLLDDLVAAPAEQEPAVILRDKLIFLQELFYAKCVSQEDYHSSKRPLLQRLAAQGTEIDARDVIIAGPNQNPEEGWSVIDLKDEDCSVSKKSCSHSKNKPTRKVFGFVPSHKHGTKIRGKDVTDLAVNQMGTVCNEKSYCDGHLKSEESERHSILMPESLPPGEPIKEEKGRKKLFRAPKYAKEKWGFDGFKKWKRSNACEDEAVALKLSEGSDNGSNFGPRGLVESPVGEGPDTKEIKKKLHPDGSPSDFFIDKVLGERIKKELSRIQTELCSSNPSLQFSNGQIEEISTKLPVDKADLKKFFPKSWCDQYGDVVLDVVKREFKDHVGEMENMRNAAREKRGN